MDGQMTAARLVILTALLAALGVMVGCGRKAPLDTPYQAAVQAREDAQKAGQPLPPAPQKPVADKPFFLDKLIQ
jgi:predicted small lipoprotein YifL